MTKQQILLAEQPAIDLIEPIRNLGAGITELDLAENKLGSKSTEEIIQVLAAIPDRITSLNLSCNGFGEKSIDEIIQILSAIPKTVKHLDFGGNFFDELEKGALARILAAVPHTVTSLSLVGNTFPQDGMELAQAFACLGPNLLTLDLYFTALARFSTEHLRPLKNSLPYVQTIYLEYDEMVTMGPEKVRILNEAFPNAEEIIVLDGTAASAAPDVIGRTNSLKKLGFKVNVPSLVNQ
ncbi:hypothetical protein, partial [Legionella sp. 29fVS95]|uniref:hypothetical protein n=1 Tax=Legionella sp. 29fVS95 TaxID=3402813 RepID=UPI003AF8E2FE